MYDKLIGSLLVSSWANSMLLMLEILQVASYYKNFKSDNSLLKGIVGTCLVLDIVCTAANHVGVYKYTITNWGNVEYLSKQEWQIPLYLYCTTVCATLVQSFLTWRFYALSKQKLVLMLLIFLVLASFAASMTVGIMLVTASSLSERIALKTPGIIWFVLSSVIDSALAGLLVWHLQSVRTNFKGTKSLINRLSSVALQSGSYTSIIALLVLFLFLGDPQSNIATGFAQCLGRIYSLTLLHNLLIRKTIREESRSATNTTGNVESFNLSGIRDRKLPANGQQIPASLNSKGEAEVGEEEFESNSKGYPLA